ncbi:MAG: HEAT repeat domain-containing protein [Leptolyngbya sp. BL-A-14]
MPALEEALGDRSDLVRPYVINAIGDLRSLAKPAIPALLQTLKHTHAKTRAQTAIALGSIGLEAKVVVPELIKTLNTDQDAEVQANAAYALSKFGVEAKEAIPSLTNALKSKNDLIRQSSAESLGSLAQVLLDEAKKTQKLEKMNETLTVLSDMDKALSNPEFEDVKKPVTRSLDSLKQALLVEGVTQWGTNGVDIWLAHLAFWLALIFAYPKSRQIQAFFFWNPWVRTIFGWGYVTFLLAWVPFLRSKLFEPFKPSLLADAGLDAFKPDLYFPDSEVSLKGTDSSQPITTVCPNIQGQRIIEGDSGLGKTMFLRHLLQQSKRIVVYLPATKCAEGVIEAIQKKLHGDEIKDTKFLQSLIYSGAIDICIDGLNEVNPDTRAKITQFVESHFKGNILMTTQPLEWLPPSTAKTYVMQPLKPDQVERYLISRQPFLPKTAPVQGGTYEKACRTFLDTMMGDQTSLSPEELKTARTILSNPMELTLAAWMLAGGVQPDLFNLREQQYKLMAEEYRKRNANKDFPLKQFSEAVYQQWLVDQKALPADKFYNELLCMEDEKFRMVVSRQWKDAKGEAKKEWYFRHDKIAEFFLVQTFLGKGADAEARLLDHIGDSRFRGVYFLLAALMDLEAAKDLREKLIQYAADTKDHTVSDTFVQLLRSR